LELHNDEIVEAESRSGEGNGLASELHELFPVTLLHVLRVKLSDQGKSSHHILQAFIEHLEGLVALDLFVELGLGLVGSHFTSLGNQTVGINLIPESLFPGVELSVNERNKIPVSLEVDKVVLALINLLEFRFSQIE
jgi:hypothetical protein